MLKNTYRMGIVPSSFQSIIREVYIVEEREVFFLDIPSWRRFHSYHEQISVNVKRGIA